MELRYQLTFTLAVTDPSALWAAAAALAMNSPNMTMDDVIETIGPIDAPQVEDCLALLIQPERFGGCDRRLGRARRDRPGRHARRRDPRRTRRRDTGKLRG